MTDILDDLRNQWKKERTGPPQSMSTEALIAASNEKLKKSRRMHLETISILMFTLVGLAAFFYWVAPVQEKLSHFGLILMMGGLAVRIVIELYSLWMAKGIDLSETASQTNTQFYRFYRYRKQIHGPVTITILIGYSLGFYLLFPEFSLYMTKVWLISFALSYVPILALIGFSIRTGVRREMKQLDAIVNTSRDLSEEPSV